MQPTAMNTMSARISTAKMIQSTPFDMVMPRTFTNVLKAMNTTTQSHQGEPGTRVVPQLATMTSRREGTRM